MFKIKRALVRQLNTSPGETISSIVDHNMTVTGEVHFKGKTRIDGTVNGTIEGDYLILSRSGRINGDIKVTTLVCHGTIEGNVRAETVKAQKNGFIYGKVTTTHLLIEPGANLDGEVTTVLETGAEQILTAPYSQKYG